MSTADLRATALISLSIEQWESGQDDPDMRARFVAALGGEPSDIMPYEELADVMVAAVTTAAALTLLLAAQYGVPTDELLAATLPV